MAGDARPGPFGDSAFDSRVDYRRRWLSAIAELQGRGFMSLRMDTERKSGIGSLIQRYREVRRMSQADLARTSGLSESVIATIESNSAQADPHDLESVCRALDISILELVDAYQWRRSSDATSAGDTER